MKLQFSTVADALPAGEWEAITEIVGAEGMMAANTDTVHATATWLRDGGVPAYLKCIGGRGGSAGPHTARLVGLDRLERLRERLLRIKAKGHHSIVRLIAADMLATTPPALLIAMELVERLHELIARSAPDVTMSLGVLDCLASGALADSWIHFDICPRNTGKTRDGRYVFIDPDSLYESEAANVEISVLACKPRLPSALNSRWKDALAPDGLPTDVAREKHNAEVIVLAAECSLGTFQYEFTLAGIESWCDAAGAPLPVKDFWRAELFEIFHGRVAAPSAVGDRLRLLQAPTIPVVVLPRTIAAAPTNFAQMVNWVEMEPARRALRADRLSLKALGEYRDALLERARVDKTDPRWWEELLVVTMAYERDPQGALKIVDEALQQIPCHEAFVRDRQVLVLWKI